MKHRLWFVRGVGDAWDELYANVPGNERLRVRVLAILRDAVEGLDAGRYPAEEIASALFHAVEWIPLLPTEEDERWVVQVRAEIATRPEPAFLAARSVYDDGPSKLEERAAKGDAVAAEAVRIQRLWKRGGGGARRTARGRRLCRRTALSGSRTRLRVPPPGGRTCCAALARLLGRPRSGSVTPRPAAVIAPPLASPSRRSWVEILIVVLLAAVPFLTVLDGPFLYDDTVYVVENHQVTQPRHTLGSLTTCYPPGGAKQALYRPLVTLSYALDHALAGLDATVFHATNTVLHVGASLAVLFLLRAWIPSAAGWAAMLFAVHPVHTEAVSWIVGRAELLCALFVLLALRSASSRPVLASGLLFLGLVSKEMAISAPLLLCLPVVFLGARLERSRPALVGFSVVLLLYLVIRSGVLGWLTPQDDKRYFPEASLLQRLPSLCVVYFEYARLALLPVGLSVDHAWPGLPTWSTPGALAGLALVVALSALSWKLRRRQPWLPVAVAWFFLALLPVSHLFPLGATWAERFLYLPSAGACLAVAALLRRIPARRVGAGALAVLVLACAILTVRRNQVWRDEERFYLAATASSPGNATLQNNLGRLHAERGELERAEALFTEALRLQPEHAPALCNLGVIRAIQGRLSEAQDLVERSLRVDPGYARGHCNFGKIRAIQGRSDDARKAFERALELRPDYPEARGELERLARPDG
jgi:tetratricopeptide (TPR) repeat protein